MPVLLLYLAGLSSLICQRWTVPTQIYLFHLTEFLWCRCGKGFWRPLESVRLHRCKGMIMCLSWEPFLLLLREEGLLSFPAISSSTCYPHPQPFFSLLFLYLSVSYHVLHASYQRVSDRKNIKRTWTKQELVLCLRRWQLSAGTSITNVSLSPICWEELFWNKTVPWYGWPSLPSPDANKGLRGALQRTSKGSMVTKKFMVI